MFTTLHFFLDLVPFFTCCIHQLLDQNCKEATEVESVTFTIGQVKGGSGVLIRIQRETGV